MENSKMICPDNSDDLIIAAIKSVIKRSYVREISLTDAQKTDIRNWADINNVRLPKSLLIILK